MWETDALYSLVQAETEEQVTEVLSQIPVAQDNANWLPYGGINNNIGAVANQQAEAYAALIEKVVNSIDAVLTLACHQAGIEPKGPGAPQSMREAVKQFFNVPEGNLALLSPSEQTTLAEQSIWVTLTGKASSPCVIIADAGEGQAPDYFPETFLSLYAENKRQVPFVQGKFNMGGTGALPFCGHHYRYQLILSRRHPDLWQSEWDEYWGFTIVRRRPAEGGERNSFYEYLAPEESVPFLKVDELLILPGPFPAAYETPMQSGTFIKLYEYGISQRSGRQLYENLNRYLYHAGLPVRVFDRRQRASIGRSPEWTVAGMSAAIDRSESAIIEEEGRFGDVLNIPDVGTVDVKMTLFKEGVGQKSSWLTPKQALLFTVNGQTHAHLPRSFYTRKRVRLDWLSEDLLAVIDCTDLNLDIQEDLFMASRDRMRECRSQALIEKALETYLMEHPALREWNHRRQQQALKKRTETDVLTKEILQEVVNASPELAELFGVGSAIKAPYVNGIQQKYEGLEFPTFLRLEKRSLADTGKICPINSTCKVVCETNAVNDYFSREKDPGRSICRPERVLRSTHLYNGQLVLTLSPPANATVGDHILVTFALQDISRIEPYAFALI